MEGNGGGGGRGSLWRREPQVRGRQPRSSELITPSISLSDPGRKQGGREEGEGGMLEGAAGPVTATGKRKLIIRLWL